MLISAAAIGYEILLMRLLSIVQWHHFAYMIISLALLGYGASGTGIALAGAYLRRHFRPAFVVCATLFAVSMPVCLVAAQHVPFNALAVVWEPRQLVYLAAVYVSFFVPFFFAASCVGMAFACLERRAHRIYLFDLSGAGLGAITIIGILFLLAPGTAVKPLSLLALAGAGLAVLESAGTGRRAGLPVLAAVGLAILALPADWLSLRLSPYKGLSQALEVVDTRVIDERSSPLGLLTVVDSPTVPFRHAPGLSLATRWLPPEQLAVFTDGDSVSPITRFTGDRQPLAYLADVTASLPYRLVARPSVLVLGAGTGTDVLAGIYHGARSIDAVELNPQMVGLVRDTYADFAGHLYQRPEVAVHVAEARGFVARGGASYDLIQIALLDSFAAAGSGVQALSESYLYTVEALDEFLRHTTPGGMVAITRWLKLPPRDSLKLIATAIRALQLEGITAPARHLAAIRSWNTVTLLMRPQPFTDDEIAALRDFADTRSFDLIWYPGMRAAEANRFNVLPAAWLHDGARELLGPAAGTFIERYKFEIEPATDERPYFFQFFRWRALPEMLELRKRGGAGLFEWGYLILIATLGQALIAGLALILLPLWRIRRDWDAGTGRRMGGYFFLLGVAFMFIEIVFIQRFILFLSHPLYSIAVVLAGFLVFAGLGSGVSVRLAGARDRRTGTPVAAVAAGITALVLVYALCLPPLFAALIGLPDIAKVAVSLMLIAPLAFLMGIPFPLGLDRLATEAAGFIPWAWGINGFASVLSASLATLLAIELGFNLVLAAAIVCYGAAALLIARRA